MSRIASSSSSPSVALDSPSTDSVPTLSSLLFSTAESLVSRSNQLSQSTPTPSKKLPTSNSASSSPFQFTSHPSSLLSHPSTASYLSSLLSEPLPSLLQLPSQLSSLSSTLDSDLSSLAFTRYPSFLLSHSSSLSISSSFSSLSSSLSSLLESTNELASTATEFSSSIKAIRERREKLQKVREKLEPLEELLESPGVLRQCIRAGLFIEAIQIVRRIEDLRKRYHSGQGEGNGVEIEVLERLGRQVEVSLRGLRGKLLGGFEERGLKLPSAVRGIGILRKLNSLTSGEEEQGEEREEEEEEQGLRIIFLTKRWKCLERELKVIEQQMISSGIKLNSDSRNDQPEREMGITRVGTEENEERTRWIKKWIETFREIVGESIGMYSEIFLSASHHSSLSTSSSSAPRVDEFLIPSSSLPASAPLSLFISSSLSSLSSILSSSLPSLTSTASLSTILTQLTYLSYSFTQRHAISFFDSLVPVSSIFSTAVLRIVENEWEHAGKEWEREWRNGWTRSGGTALSMNSTKLRKSGKSPIKDWLVVPEGVSQLLSTPLPSTPTNFTFQEEETSSIRTQPSPTLSLLPPLTHLLNSYINSLNSLRLLPPARIFRDLLRVQSRELERCSRVLEAFVDAWLTSYESLSTTTTNRTIQEEEGTEEETMMRREREEELQIVLTSIAWFGRELIPWLRNSLVRGVYGELGYQGGEEELEAGLREARKRVERLMSRIKGEEWVDPEEVVERKEETNGETKDEEEMGEGELPVLEIPSNPLESNGTSPTTTMKEEEEDDRPLEFSTTTTNGEPSAMKEPALESIGDTEDEKDENKPYLVDEVAPPLPVPLEEEDVGTSRDG
ncbi:uncharacterized protein JCM6883_004588 [Sporobolomyces salmoneus]|uniref:uncharacterized protein n=1 Tax=Sporobolomyces salmoneus TaxID=183962 RepID=UPI00316BE146